MHELESYLKKSTSVRSFYGSHVLRALGRTWPGPTSRLLTDLFLKPLGQRPRAGRPRGSQELELKIEGAPSVGAVVVGDGPLVVLVHGWAGSSGQLVPLRDRLLQKGFRVAWFDAPAHGGQPGQRTHIGQFVALLLQLQEKLGPCHGLIGHSLGGLAACLACQRGFRTRRLMLLAPMPSFDFALDQYQATLGFSAHQRESIAARVEGLTGFSRKEASLRTALSRLQQELLIIHDRDDRRIPFLHSRELSRPPWGAEYVETRNLGHQRLLTSAEVLDCAAGWLSRSADARGSAPSLAAE